MEHKPTIVGGIPIPGAFSAEAFKSAINYKPKHGDLFLVSYPKCGTTWTQKIILLILRKGRKPSNDTLDDMFFACPYLEMSGVEAMESIPKPLAIKIHLPYHLSPISKDAKYVYVCRNPMDCAVSYYHHIKNFMPNDYTFDKYFEALISGNIAYGDYLDHLIGWYEHRNDNNIHFVTYEALKEDTKKETLKIARFIGEEYEKMLLDNPNMLEDILLYSSFGYMKEQVDETMRKFRKGEVDAGNRIIPKGMQVCLEAFRKASLRSNVPKENFMRKGVVGDWKNYFSPEQKRRYEEKIAEKTANCDVMNLWK